MSVFPDPLSLSAGSSAAFTIVALALFALEGGGSGQHAFRRWGLACLAAAAAFALATGPGFSSIGSATSAAPSATLPTALPTALSAAMSSASLPSPALSGSRAAAWHLLSDLLLGAAFIPAARALAGACRHGIPLIRLALGANLVHLVAATATFRFAPDPHWHAVASAIVAALGLGVAAVITMAPLRIESTRFLRVAALLLAIAAVPALLRASFAFILGPDDQSGTASMLMLMASSAMLALPMAVVVHGYRQVAGLLRQSALLDPLTGLVNRRGLAQAWVALSARAQRGDQAWHIGVVMIDVDDFRAINQRHGQAQGDLVLQIVADTLRQTGRRYDVAGRFDGQQFCMLLPGVTIRQAQAVTERIRSRFAGLVLERVGIEATLSAGVTVADAGSATLQQATDTADQMLHTAKHDGQNRSRVDPDAVRVVSGMKPLGQSGTHDQFGFPLV